MYKISIIVPVYNVEKYLKRCIDSLINQTLKEIEIILINDGSTDNSFNILQEYKKYRNVKVITKKNTGVSDTRNLGIKLASGKYLSFIDSDDYIELDMMQIMYEKIESEKADLVVCDYTFIYDNKKLNKDMSGGNFEINYPTIEKDLIKYILGFPCNKIYKKEILDEKKIEFPLNLIYEDSEFNFKYFFNCKKIVKIDRCFLKYYQRNGSLTKTIGIQNLDNITIFKNIKKYLKEKEKFEEYQKLYKGMFFNHLISVAVLDYRILNKNERIEFRNKVNLAIKKEELLEINNNYIDKISLVKYFLYKFKMSIYFFKIFEIFKNIKLN